MESIVHLNDAHEPVAINLRNRWLAALLAWLIPGVGHLYQTRHAKGILFLVCILGTYLFGFELGERKVVYASFDKSIVRSFRRPLTRWPYICQFGVGLPALPALVQWYHVEVQQNDRDSLWNGFMAPPGPPDLRFHHDSLEYWQWLEQHEDQLASWHRKLHFRFELGTLFTMIAGLLNVLAIYDAYAGPVFLAREEKQDKQPPGGAERKSKSPRRGTRQHDLAQVQDSSG